MDTKISSYKETPIGKIPEDWEIVRLGDKKVSELIKSGSTPSKKKAEYWNGEIPFVTIGDMTKTGKYLFDTHNKITELALKKTNTFLVPENSILLSMYGTIGKVVINKAQVAISQNIAGIIPNRDYTNEEFLYYALQQFSFQFSSAKIITLKHLDIKMVKNMLIPLPPLEEQRKIAEILSTVDKAIEKVNEAIAKTEKLKKGLMQELLTKGIGHKEFKDTEIGKIPKDWEILSIGELIKKKVILEIQDGNHGELHPKAHEFADEGIPFITANSIKNGKLDLNECKYLPEQVIRRLVKGFAKPRDVLLTHKGSIGLTAIVPENLDYVVLSPQVTYYRLNENKLLSEFLYYVFQTNYIKMQLIPLSKQSTRDYISLERQKKIKIPLPPLPEQQKIAEILSTIDKKLELERKRKEKLERIKKGLMNDLLTGKRRVKV